MTLIALPLRNEVISPITPVRYNRYMQVRVLGGVEDIQVTTVTLERDIHDAAGMHMKMFHCPLCGSPVMQYTGHVSRVFPGMEPVILPIIVQCSNKRRCTAKYLFRAIV